MEGSHEALFLVLPLAFLVRLHRSLPLFVPQFPPSTRGMIQASFVKCFLRSTDENARSELAVISVSDVLSCYRDKELRQASKIKLQTVFRACGVSWTVTARGAY